MHTVLAAHYKFGRYWIYKGTPVAVIGKRGECLVVEAVALNGVTERTELITVTIIPKAIEVQQRKAA